MNKRIYYGSSYIEFINDSQLHQNQNIINLNTLDNEPLTALLHSFINDSTKHLVFSEKNFDLVFTALRSFCKYIESAGGFIEKKGLWLCIHRLNKWDLPKGKLNKGESPEQAAIRECEEECGISELTVKRPLQSTWHIYPFKNGFALKQTFWFEMNSSYEGELIPQVEEDIFEAKWFTRDEIKANVLPNTYFTIQQVIEEAWT